MNNQKAYKNNTHIHSITIILFVLCSLFMFNFYKTLSGFVANGFRSPLFMIPIFSSYLLPALCFLFYFYDFYLKKISKVARISYISVVLIWAITNLALIFNKISIYISNNKLGVYDTLYGIIFKFPYDGIIINIFLIAMQALGIVLIVKSNSNFAVRWEEHKSYGVFKLSTIEYLPLCILAILSFVFTGDAFNSLNAIENALYDPKYIYLILWVLIVPAGNLILLAFKPENRSIKKSAKITILSLGIGINVIFALLLFVFEKTSPNFIVYIGKPLFLIAFSVSMPIEMIILLSIGLISVIIYTIKLVLLFVVKSNMNEKD